MSVPTAFGTTAPASPFSIVAKKHRDGSVVLSTTSDRIFKLNGVGALTWTVLEQSPNGLSLDEIVDELRRQFENINRDGEERYETSREQLRTDTARFLAALGEAGLVLIDPSGRETYRIAEGVCGTTSKTLADVTSTETTDSLPFAFPAKPVSETAKIRPRKWETLTAFCGLFAFDLLLRFRGFAALIKKVESWPTFQPHTLDTELCRRVCAAVNRAQVYYPKKAMCLQHSAVVTCLLRRKGVPAEMVLAAQEFPPKAHAWVEVAGTVVNDFKQVKTRYRELKRI
ncbi:MAG TPA: lasso peptide biosynthesis B2 protein [Pyrinomonadaceae bacterium]|nr:lasso peptide biosynthesis B2 protein [Pyrinomonadaceae bacterium]